MSESAADRMMILPVVTSPVSDTIRTRGWVTREAPACSPSPVTTLKTPGGRMSVASSASFSAVRGVSSEGLSTTVLPAARAGPIFQPAIIIG